MILLRAHKWPQLLAFERKPDKTAQPKVPIRLCYA